MNTQRFHWRPWLAAVLLNVCGLAQAEIGPAEQPDLKLGFIKLTDMAPLAVAWEQGYFLDEGLFVELEAEANWKVLLDRVITGELDGNGITVSNDVWTAMKPQLAMEEGKPEHPISASALKPVVEQAHAQGERFRMGMVFPVSTHNYELRYWLAAGGLNPGFYAPQRGAGDHRL